MDQFIEYIQESIKTIENMDLKDEQKALVASRLDSICAFIQITIFHLKKNTYENEKQS